MTRIIAGRLGGRRLAVPDEGTRPTSDRVREAVFSMLAARIDLDDARVLDLYAGSGALGLEAISRGARSATFVDSSRRVGGVIRANAGECGVSADVTVISRPVSTYLAAPTGGPFDLVFSDPPYDIETKAIEADLAALANGPLADGAVIVLERSARAAAPEWPGGFEVIVDKKYGDTRVEVARHGGD